MTFCKPYLYVFGGTTGAKPANDLWCLNLDKTPFAWVNVQCTTESPPARVYHSAAQCLSGSAAGMLVIFGGRGVDQLALNDAWGLRQHHDGTWDWVKAPYMSDTPKPLPRFQHSSIFIGSFMAIIGGKTNSTGDDIPFNVYDAESAEWFSFNPVKRFRHGSWISDGIIYVFGGFQQTTPNVPSDTIIHIDYSSLVKTIQAKQLENSKEENKVEVKEEPADEARIVTEIKSAVEDRPPLASNANSVKENQAKEDAKQLEKKVAVVLKLENKDFKLSSQAHVALSFDAINKEKKYKNHVETIPVVNLREEAKKLGASPILPTAEPQKSINENLCMLFINSLMDLKPNAETNFEPLTNYVIELAKEFKMVLEFQSTVVNLRPPLKVFGSVYGNFNDLVKIFELWKPPTSSTFNGDIDSMGYLFLGNYVDRTKKSLETICLLMALKLKYPDSIYLLRGSHEDPAINSLYGFGEECTTRLKEDINNPNSVFQIINEAFTWLPLAAIIDNKILCVHGGIGPSVNMVEDINKVRRPIKLGDTNKYQAIFVECLWSDPTQSEAELGFQKNTSRKDIRIEHTYRFGSDVLNKFLEKNELELIIRSHEIAPEGFDTFADSRLITLTSCTNYCGVKGNSAAVLIIKKTLEIIPKILLPTLAKTGIWAVSKESLKKYPVSPSRPKTHS